MRIAIMGAGGVGGYVGARLAESGRDVTFVARGAHLRAMQDHGLRLESPLGDATLRPVRASDDPGAVGPVDLVLLAVKLYDVETAALACRPLLGARTGVVTFQNGVDAPEIVAGALGREHVVGGVAQIRAMVAEPGLIRHVGITPRYIFGELDGRSSERVEALAGALRAAGVEHEVSADIQADLWRKMIFLASLSGMTSLVRLPIGPIREDPETRAMLRACVDEAFAVARAKGVALPADAPERIMAGVGGLQADNTSSMFDDLAAGRRLELPWLSGAIARMGRELDVPTPTHAFITTALKLHAGGRA